MRTVVSFTDSVEFGGAERALVTLCAGLDRARWRAVIVHHPGADRLAREASEAGVPTRVVPRLGCKSDLAKLPVLIRALRDERAALFHAHLNWPGACLYGLLGAALARVPGVVATQQLLGMAPPARLLRRQRLFTFAVDRYIAVSHDMARRMRAARMASPAKIRVVHNSVDARRFEFEPARRRGAERPLVLAVARLEKQKGLAHLLAAATQIPDARFAIAGEGSERSSLEAEARRLGVEKRVEFLGDRTDVPALLASCDVFVLPSLFEGLPLSVLEAMAAGAPVVASAIGGTMEAVEHGVTGLLVPPGDPRALAEAIVTVLGDRALAAGLAERGRALVETRFSAAAMVAETTAVYDEVIAAA